MATLPTSGLKTISLYVASISLSLHHKTVDDTDGQTDGLPCRPSHSERNRPVFHPQGLPSLPLLAQSPCECHLISTRLLPVTLGHYSDNVRTISGNALGPLLTLSVDSPNIPQYTFLLGLLLGIISSPALFFADIISASSPRVRPRLTLLWCA